MVYLAVNCFSLCGLFFTLGYNKKYLDIVKFKIYKIIKALSMWFVQLKWWEWELNVTTWKFMLTTINCCGLPL